MHRLGAKQVMRRFRSLNELSCKYSTNGSTEHPVCSAFRAIVGQQSALLQELTDNEYIFKCPTLQGSTGGHIRHSLDHLRRSLAIGNSNEIHYDIRERNTFVEQDRLAAMNEMESILANLSNIVDVPKHLNQPVEAVFFLSAEGNETKFKSTIEREMGFAVHHAIHHNAMIKVIVSTHFPHVDMPSTFGIAPSTIQYNNQTVVEKL